MKKIFTFLTISLGFFQNAQATILTVSNNTNSPGQYTNLQTACDAANSNDTIYIHASETTYGDITLRKPLVLIGEGMLPNEQMLLETSLNSLTFSYMNPPSTITSSGSKVYGIKILGGSTSIGTNSSGVPLSSITFERCKLLGINLSGASSTHNNIIFQQCVIGTISSSGPFTGLSSSLISNCLINTLYISNNYGASNVMRNCLYGSGSINAKGFLFANNIFYNPTVNFTNTTGTVNSIFNNNIFYYQNTPTITNGTTTASGNVFSDPMFITPQLVQPVTQYTYNTVGPFADFNLQAGSPALTLGTDGTQAGLYGSTTPWIDGTGGGVFRYNTMVKQVPYVIDMNIQNSSIPVNGTLNVQINARTQD